MVFKKNIGEIGILSIEEAQSWSRPIEGLGWIFSWI